MCHPTYSSALKVDVSRLPRAGLGVFATKDFAPGDFVDVYDGKIFLTSSSYIAARDQNPKIADYVYFVNHDVTVDASATDCCYARYINDSRRQGISPNTYFRDFDYHKDKKFPGVTSRFKDARVCVITKCFIPAGSEFYISYGSGYWKDEVAVPSSLCFTHSIQKIIRQLDQETIRWKAKELQRLRKRSVSQEARQRLRCSKITLPIFGIGDKDNSKMMLVHWTKHPRSLTLRYDNENQMWLTVFVTAPPCEQPERVLNSLSLSKEFRTFLLLNLQVST